LNTPKGVEKEIIYLNFLEVISIGENLNGMKFSNIKPLNLDKKVEQKLEYLFAEIAIS